MTKLIVGLGNIGTQYKNTRHNTGFMTLDMFAQQKSLQWLEKPKFKALITEFTLNDQKIITAKPTTFYNQAGETVKAIKDFYKIENKGILVVHDELSLPFGTVRARLGGSAAGNNGIKSISAHIEENYYRLRIGIGHESSVADPKEFVLRCFSADEKIQLNTIFETIVLPHISSFITDNFMHTTEKISQKK